MFPFVPLKQFQIQSSLVALPAVFSAQDWVNKVEHMLCYQCFYVCIVACTYFSVVASPPGQKRGRRFGHSFSIGMSAYISPRPLQSFYSHNHERFI